jgi:acyl dehydratase
MPVPDRDDVVGKPTTRGVIRVERGPVSNFASALKDDNPVYHDEAAANDAGFDNIPAPPTWGFAMGHWGKFPEEQPADDPSKDGSPMMAVMGGLMAEGGLILHGEEEFEYHKPLVVGQTLQEEGKITDFYTKESSSATMTFLVTETEYRDDDGDLVLTARMNLIHRK